VLDAEETVSFETLMADDVTRVIDKSEVDCVFVAIPALEAENEAAAEDTVFTRTQNTLVELDAGVVEYCALLVSRIDEVKEAGVVEVSISSDIGKEEGGERNVDDCVLVDATSEKSSVEELKEDEMIRAELLEGELTMAERIEDDMMEVDVLKEDPAEDEARGIDKLEVEEAEEVIVVEGCVFVTITPLEPEEEVAAEEKVFTRVQNTLVELLTLAMED